MGLEDFKESWVAFVIVALSVLGGLQLLLVKAIDVVDLFKKLW